VTGIVWERYRSSEGSRVTSGKIFDKVWRCDGSSEGSRVTSGRGLKSCKTKEETSGLTLLASMCVV